MVDVLSGFVGELRAAGLPVSMTEHLDAMAALAHVPLEDREAFKYALGATLVKNDAHWRAFETIFDVYFSPRAAGWAGPSASDDGADAGVAALAQELDAGRQAGDAALAAMSAEELMEMLYRALHDGDEELLAALARQAVNRFAGMEPGRPVGGTYYLYRTLRHLDLDGVRGRLMGGVAAGAEATDESGPSDLEARLAREEFDARLERLRRLVEAEIRRRLVADRGAAAMAKSLRKALPEDVDFMHATQEELASLRRAIQPLTRRLAVRLARKRRHGRRGPLDFRSTVRHSLSYGGVPAEPKFRDPRPAKPEIVVLADISGSVAAFARFTLQLVHAISSQFSRVRSFVFIDGIDEVTSYFDGVEDIGAAIHRVNTSADVIWVDGHSDYGHALEAFWTRWGDQLTPRTSVIILGDARNNYHASQSWVVQEIAKRARHLYWLNPEPRAYWDTGDSIVSQYGVFCEGVFECRN
ncbi:MAG TPA: VWA domain-containing protein, partial [Acidimicrobiales bacterium]|nr:VWA domain-containing protein [Acidimicrobiales bacterium]